MAIPLAGPTLEERLAGAPTLWQLACALLCHWRDTAPTDTAQHANDDVRYMAWGTLVNRAEDRFGGRGEDDACRPDDVDWVLAESGADADAVHAIGWGLCKVASHTFAPAWRRELGGQRRILRAGDCYPVADAWDPEQHALTARPDSLGTRLDELPAIRVHDGSFDVTVDCSLEAQLEALARNLREVVTCHPNEGMQELAIDVRGNRIFPVKPLDEGAQQQLVLDLLDQALGHGPQAIVFPELSVTPKIVDAVQRRMLLADGPCLVVAGSFHRERGSVAENVAVGLVSGRTERIEHRKTVPFTDELRPGVVRKEGIDRARRCHVTVFQANCYRVAIVICKELLSATVAECLDRMGANLVFVPALSLKTDDFRNAASGRVLGAQALVVVANGPLRDEDDRSMQPAAVLAQPVQPSPRSYVLGRSAPTLARLGVMGTETPVSSSMTSY